MKNQSWFVLAAVFVLSCQFILASTTITWSVSDLAIESTAPPAVVYVEDGQGRISGADPSQSTNSIGEQVSELNGLVNIPSSFVMQDNSSVVDDSGDVSPSQDTMWSINIYDGGTQTYTINVSGLATGNEQINITASLFRRKGVKNTINVLVEKNQLRQVGVTYNPDANTLVLKRIVSKDDLLNDVEIACQLTLITSNRVCKHLEEKAMAIQDALANNHEEQAVQLIQSFLYSLGVGNGYGNDNQDDHGAIKQPALTELIEDANALLAGLSDHHQHHGD